MGYTQADFETMTGAELDAVRKEYEAAGIAPQGWAKMRVSEKAKWLGRYASEFRLAQRGKSAIAASVSAGVAFASGLKAAVEKGLGFDKPERTRMTVEHPAFRKWKTPKGRHFFKVKKIAADPDPITRQVARANERRASKMPIGARQDEWHKLSGFAKVRPFMSSRRRKASPAEAV